MIVLNFVLSTKPKKSCPGICYFQTGPGPGSGDPDLVPILIDCYSHLILRADGSNFKFLAFFKEDLFWMDLFSRVLWA